MLHNNFNVYQLQIHYKLPVISKITLAIILLLAAPSLVYADNELSLWLIGKEIPVRNNNIDREIEELKKALSKSGIVLEHIDGNTAKLRVLHQKYILNYLKTFAENKGVTIKVRILSWNNAYFLIKRVLSQESLSYEKPDIIQIGSSWLPDIVEYVKKVDFSGISKIKDRFPQYCFFKHDKAKSLLAVPYFLDVRFIIGYHKDKAILDKVKKISKKPILYNDFQQLTEYLGPLNYPIGFDNNIPHNFVMLLSLFIKKKNILLKKSILGWNFNENGFDEVFNIIKINLELLKKKENKEVIRFVEYNQEEVGNLLAKSIDNDKQLLILSGFFAIESIQNRIEDTENKLEILKSKLNNIVIFPMFQLSHDINPIHFMGGSVFVTTQKSQLIDNLLSYILGNHNNNDNYIRAFSLTGYLPPLKENREKMFEILQVPFSSPIEFGIKNSYSYPPIEDFGLVVEAPLKTKIYHALSLLQSGGNVSDAMKPIKIAKMEINSNINFLNKNAFTLVLALSFILSLISYKLIKNNKKLTIYAKKLSKKNEKLANLLIYGSILSSMGTFHGEGNRPEDVDKLIRVHFPQCPECPKLFKIKPEHIKEFIWRKAKIDTILWLLSSTILFGTLTSRLFTEKHNYPWCISNWTINEMNTFLAKYVQKYLIYHKIKIEEFNDKKIFLPSYFIEALVKNLIKNAQIYIHDNKKHLMSNSLAEKQVWGKVELSIDWENNRLIIRIENAILSEHKEKLESQYKIAEALTIPDSLLDDEQNKKTHGLGLLSIFRIVHIFKNEQWVNIKLTLHDNKVIFEVHLTFE
jgi:hypothetical protein